MMVDRPTLDASELLAFREWKFNRVALNLARELAWHDQELRAGRRQGAAIEQGNIAQLQTERNDACANLRAARPPQEPYRPSAVPS